MYTSTVDSVYLVWPQDYKQTLNLLYDFTLKYLFLACLLWLVGFLQLSYILETHNL